MTGTEPATRWNGEQCTAVRVKLRVEMPPHGQHPQYWARDLVGTVRKAVRVEYHGTVFYLDDETGAGWEKVTIGGGSPHWPSDTLYGVEVAEA